MINNNDNNDMVVSYITIRRAIGWLGMLLPFALLVGNYTVNSLGILNNSFFIQPECSTIYSAQYAFKSSISHFYYTSVGELFTGILITVALFMFCYKGHKQRKGEKCFSDSTLTNLAGFFALGIVVFPTSSADCLKDNLRSFQSSANTGTIHFIMAALFFITLSWMSIFNFRRTDHKNSLGNNKEHKTYLICGIGMLASIALIFIYSKWLEDKYPWLDNLRPVFCLETIALIFFGISWLIKGNIDFLYIPKKLNLIK